MFELEIHATLLPLESEATDIRIVLCKNVGLLFAACYGLILMLHGTVGSIV